jgi:glycosyltransferase involved in cell wall biosynthesis
VKDHVFVIQTSNYRWILGHWVRQISKCVPGSSTIWWIPISFSKSGILNEILKKFPLPRSRAYFFTQPTLFENYLRNMPERLEGRAVVLYTHNDNSLGDDLHQVEVLSKCNKVHFMCSLDAERLVKSGLAVAKARTILGAVDSNCFKILSVERKEKSILLSSKFGPRKGGNVLSDLVKSMPEWTFTILGTGWEEYIHEKGLNNYSNFEYILWNESARNYLMSRHTIFLSLSNLEGGPIPLIEALNCGMFAIATDTGFARDIIADGINGRILPIESDYEKVKSSIIDAKLNEAKSIESVSELSWDRLARLYLCDVSIKSS